MVGIQLLFSPGQAPPHRVLLGGGVVIEHPVAGLQIQDIAGVQQLHPAARKLQGHLPTLAALHPLDGPGELGAERPIADRLEHIIQRVHLVPLDGVLGHVGHEHQHHIRVHRTDALRRPEAAQPGHFHIQKNDVIPGLVPLSNDGPVRKGFHFRL